MDDKNTGFDAAVNGDTYLSDLVVTIAALISIYSSIRLFSWLSLKCLFKLYLNIFLILFIEIHEIDMKMKEGIARNLGVSLENCLLSESYHLLSATQWGFAY